MIEFPKFPKGMKQHMPFVNRVGNYLEFLVCLAPHGSHKWKIYRWNESSWERLTSNPEDITECNPVFCVEDDKVTYSYIVASESEPGYVCTVPIPIREYLKSRNVVCIGELFRTENSSRAIYGCYWFKQIQNNNQKKIVDGIDLSQWCDMIYSVRGNPDGGLLVTYEKDKIRKSCWIKEDGSIFRLFWSQEEVYKPCSLDGQWWHVITIPGNDDENRFVFKTEIQIEGMN